MVTPVFMARSNHQVVPATLRFSIATEALQANKQCLAAIVWQPQQSQRLSNLKSSNSRPHPQYGWDSRKNSGKTLETLSELFLEFPSRVRLGSSKPYNSRHLKAPERFQNSLPPSTAGDASFFRSGSGEGLSEPVMEFPAEFIDFVFASTYSRFQSDTPLQPECPCPCPPQCLALGGFARRGVLLTPSATQT